MGGEEAGEILKLRKDAAGNPWLAAECLTAFVRGDSDAEEEGFAGAMLVADAIDALKRLCG